MGLLGVGWCGGGFRRFVRFSILTDETIAGTIDAGLACKKINAIRGVVGACSGTVGADITYSFLAGGEIGASGKIILCHGGTIKMRTGGESAANAKDNSEG